MPISAEWAKIVLFKARIQVSMMFLLRKDTLPLELWDLNPYNNIFNDMLFRWAKSEDNPHTRSIYALLEEIINDTFP